MTDTTQTIGKPAAHVLEYLRACVIPPTHREIMDACKISSTSVVRYYLDELEQAGCIERPGEPGSSRNIVVVKNGDNDDR